MSLRSIGKIFSTPWLLANSCLLCGATGTEGLALCNGCVIDLPRIDRACALCGLPINKRAGICGHCLSKPPHFNAAVIPLLYAHPTDALIQALKFNQRLSVATLLGQLLLQAVTLRTATALPERIIPVPLHPQRLRERGFNQSLEIARIVARGIGIPLDIKSCRRVKATATQSSLSAKARRCNIRDAFAAEPMTGVSRVAIVDDVVTTGETVNELARTLRRTGVDEIVVWACARAE